MTSRPDDEGGPDADRVLEIAAHPDLLVVDGAAAATDVDGVRRHAPA